jgi:heptosyltransferase II
MQKLLVIQTAFIGDVVLVTGLLEDLHIQFPEAVIDILVRKGNESLFHGHPFLNEVLIWNKKKHKYSHLFHVIQQIRKIKYDRVINVQRYAATGLITILSGAKESIGFDKNPFSKLFSHRITHVFSKADVVLHEIERNFQLIEDSKHIVASKPKLYPSLIDKAAISKYTLEPYICIAPASVWFTKQFPAIKWIEFLQVLPKNYPIYLLGAPSDISLCKEIMEAVPDKMVTILAGKLNFLESAALMEKAVMNYVNDSAPMHFASAVNAPVTAIYCSTIPAFGYGPLSENSTIVELQEPLSCRPCGIHGKKSCPETHFNCAMKIRNEQLLASLPND